MNDLIAKINTIPMEWCLPFTLLHKSCHTSYFIIVSKTFLYLLLIARRKIALCLQYDNYVPYFTEQSNTNTFTTSYSLNRIHVTADVPSFTWLISFYFLLHFLLSIMPILRHKTLKFFTKNIFY